MSDETKQTANAGEIDFSAIFAILWKRRNLIVFGTLAATAFAVVASLLIPRTFRSEGFFQLGHPREDASIGVPIPVYKKNSPQFFNSALFVSFAGEEKTFGQAELNAVRSKFRTADNIAKWITPVYAFSKADMRDLAQLPKEETNAVIGVNLSYEADSPRKAYDFVRFFGRYIRDVSLYTVLYDYVMTNYSQVLSEKNEIENRIFDTTFKLKQNSDKIGDIKAIVNKYPESTKIDNRQVVSVQEGGARFLAPISQLVGLESERADLGQAMTSLERERRKSSIKNEYFSRCKDDLGEAHKKGGALFLQLKAIKRELFQTKNFKDNVVKEVFNELGIDLQRFDLAYYTHCRFVSGPTIPLRHVKPKRSVIVIVAFFLSALFFLFLALFLSWWQQNRNSILAAGKKEK